MSLVRSDSIAVLGCGVGSPINALVRVGICRSLKILVGQVTRHHDRQLVEHLNKLTDALRGRFDVSDWVVGFIVPGL